MCTASTGLYIHHVTDTTHLGPKDSLHSSYLLLKLQQTAVLQVNPLIINQPEKESVFKHAAPDLPREYYGYVTGIIKYILNFILN